ncbi:nicotinate-nicotinamide nucleotide adenylyltransferase [Photobacterium carnosum]|jgi:nicotinate-nucleotide adenylyltransferase|uniref:nicotinate-nicotinamide nucleotide adenylyltransferase n=1 Tax=Photobacterium carnosum TaxID=2023717 RepID=UPI001E2DEE11|nr:nicotinate-nicotinamide nucleotide adenylyltransferase [Photobacterium carnosum]MCD9530420.1 nicotinate-nicotinamide nucleotide adenylyltransferase [Photobacterium carnosum]MCD9537208.1 nicotinate-nicotinamide nucleotide adenylyltransferase [Photobacterium carnosum]MCD9548952.1 nicotinate-nicotinamide nucleotide adenylyltransferase [Photobacterium carnosum]MCF2153148.1 nicotinate-nicotinamide nucleotide adenylyltransferase [Photobacterium carnosum]MCF2161753.1 nicotinate-nicotinamide nucleo
MKQTLAVFGSAFNPPSLGHRSVLERLSQFDKVLLLPSYQHAWGKVMLDYDARCDLVRAFISDIGQSNLELSTLEQQIAIGDNAVTTYSVLKNLQLKHPDTNITFVVGPDNFLNFHRFYKADEILKQWQIMACPETVPIRSTLIREALASNDDISQYTTPTVKLMLMNDERFLFTH